MYTPHTSFIKCCRAKTVERIYQVKGYILTRNYNVARSRGGGNYILPKTNSLAAGNSGGDRRGELDDYHTLINRRPLIEE